MSDNFRSTKLFIPLTVPNGKRAWVSVGFILYYEALDSEDETCQTELFFPEGGSLKVQEDESTITKLIKYKVSNPSQKG